MKMSKKKKMRFFLKSQGSFNSKIKFLGRKMCSVARVRTDRQTDTQTHTKVTTVGTLLGFQDFFPPTYHQGSAQNEHLQSEIEAGRIPGHLDEPPFKNFQINSMGLVKKKEKNKFRMIYDLSHPKKDSINSNIADIFSEVSYSSLEDALHLITMCGPSVYLAKADIKSAFRLLPVRPD